jgi:hypothetical protein
LSEIESTFHLLKVLEYDRAQSFEVALLLLWITPLQTQLQLLALHHELVFVFVWLS